MNEPSSPLQRLSEEAVWRLEETCCRFEEAWQAGQRPCLEDFVSGTEGEERLALLRELLRLEVYYRRQAGEGPSAGDYETRFPEATAVLQELFAAPAGPDRPPAPPRPETDDPERTGPELRPQGADEEQAGVKGDMQVPGEPAPQQAVEGLGGSSRADASVLEELPPGFLQPSERPGGLGKLGHYEILEVIGRGAMGIVFRARDDRLHRVVAVKVMAPQLAAIALARQRFTREAQAVAAVSHDHVVTIHAVEEAQGLPYLVMQYISGVSLQERLRRSGALAVKEVLRIGMQTAAGLAAAHAQGLIHRDIKPANILLENGVERAKLADFGLARAGEDAHLTEAGCLVGTLMYMSPEGADGGVVDQRSDLFSLGSVLYEMSTGRPPFRGETRSAVLRAVAEAAPRPVRELNPEVPEELAAVITQLHAKDPARRYQTAAEVAKVLEELLAEAQHFAPAVARMRPRRAAGQRRLVLAAVGVLAAVVLAALFLWPRGNKGEGKNGDPGDRPSAPPKPILPADLARLKPEFDSNVPADHAPLFVSAVGQAGGLPNPWQVGWTAEAMIKFPKYVPTEDFLKYRLERHSVPGAAWAEIFHPGARGERWARGDFKRRFWNTYAFRLEGRIKSDNRIAMSIHLKGERGLGDCVAVLLWNTGELEVTRAPFATGSFRFHRQTWPCKEVMRPGDQVNQLLVIVQKGRMRVFVNGQEIGQPVELPEVVIPTDLGQGAYCPDGCDGRIELTGSTRWDLDNSQWRPRDEPPRIPADLPRLKPVVDHDFSDASKSPFEHERVPPPKGKPPENELKTYRLFGRETIFLFDPNPGKAFRWMIGRCDQGPATNFACRLRGRIKSGDRAAMSLWLGESPPLRCLGVQVWNNGELTVERPPWNKTAFAFPRKTILDEAIRPGDQTNELLVVIQDRQLRTFVNDREIGQAIKLPEVLSPTDLGIGARHIGAGAARVQFLQYTLWDLDNPQWRPPAEARPSPRPAKPSEDKKRQPD
jgi:tRNA A-37 threonylcarbamoyl transferase component Bud32